MFTLHHPPTHPPTHPHTHAHTHTDTHIHTYRERTGKKELKNQAGQNYRGRIAGSRQNITDYVITHPRLKWRENCFDRSGFSAMGTP